MVLTQHEDDFEMFCFDPLMKAVLKYVPFEPSIKESCNKNKLRKLSSQEYLLPYLSIHPPPNPASPLWRTKWLGTGKTGLPVIQA